MIVIVVIIFVWPMTGWVHKYDTILLEKNPDVYNPYYTKTLYMEYKDGKNPWKSIIDDKGLTKDDFDTGLLYSLNCDWYLKNDTDKADWARQWELDNLKPFTCIYEAPDHDPTYDSLVSKVEEWMAEETILPDSIPKDEPTQKCLHFTFIF